MSLLCAQLLCCLLWIMSVVPACGDSAYGLISDVTTECEYMGLTVGSRLCDAFNSADEESTEDRLHHDFMFNSEPHNEVFVKMLHSDHRRHHYSWGLPHGKGRASLSHHRNSSGAAAFIHHHSSNGDREPHHANASALIFHELAGKSIYLLGDSSLLPIYRALISPIHSHDPKWDFNTWSKQKCMNLGGDDQRPLGDNSICRSIGYRSARDGEGEIIFERQDYLLERLEAEWLYNHSTLGIGSAIHKQRPDILVLQLGRLSCFDAHNSSDPTEKQKSQPKTSENMIHTFMTAVKDVVTANRAKNDLNTTVIVSLAGRNHLDNHDSNVCTWHMNRIFSFGAHYQGFPVLEREELEFRLLFKSEHSPHPFIKPKSLMNTPPAPQIIATSLLTIYSCMKANITFSLTNSH